MPALLASQGNALPLYQDIRGTKAPLAAFIPGTPAIILGKITGPANAYLAQVNGQIGYLAPENVTTPKDDQNLLGAP